MSLSAPHNVPEYYQHALVGCGFVRSLGLLHSGGQQPAVSVIHGHHSDLQEQTMQTRASTIIPAAWALVAGQMINSEDIIFDTTVTESSSAAGENEVMGRTVATVSISIMSSSNMKVSEYLKTVQQQVTDKRSFQPAESQKINGAYPDTQQARRLKTLLVIQQLETDEEQDTKQNDDQLLQLDIYNLVLRVRYGQDKTTIAAYFDSRVIRSWVMQKLLRRYDHVICQLGQARASQLLAEIDTILPQDLEQIWEWNSALPPPAEKTAYQMFADRVQAKPDALAICSWDGELTYRKLDQLANAVAGKLIELGVGQDVLVPLCFEKSVWTTVAILGVVRAGGGFVLLDPSLPEHRLRTIVKQVKGNLILCSVSQQNLSSRLAQQTITIDSTFFAKLGGQDATYIHEPSPSSIIYVIFTSGSTGTPKGAMVTYINLASALHYQVELLGLTAESRLFDFASYSFDGSINNLFTVLAAGGCLCVPSDEDRQNNLEQSIVSLRANVLDLTPSVAQLLSPDKIPEVASIIFAGEALRVSDAERWCGKVKVRNGYGPSECTPTATINSSVFSPEEAIHMGKGAGLVTWVVDAENHDKLLPPGCVGELLLEGPLVCRGYLDDEEKTATAFIKSPVWLQRGTFGRPGRHGRLYKTGDLVRYNEDGSLTYVCRKDAQVKLRGQRVELGEIEHVIRSHDCVDESVVISQHDEGQEPWIASFITVRNSDNASVDERPSSDEEVQHTEAWKNHFNEEAYIHIKDIRPETIGCDFIGWSSMYDQNDIDKAEMKEWLDDTIETMLNGGTPGNVLEIGTGSGMVLFNLAQGLHSFVGLEPSDRAVDFINQTIKTTPSLADKVKVYKGTAADLGQLHTDAPISPNLVVLNSVIQYFPSQSYLFGVIQSILQLSGVQTIYFGDIRSYPLYRQFLAAKALHVAGENPSKDEIRRIMDNLEKAESELLIDPGFFTALPTRLPDQIAYVEILPKKMYATNELSCYRYSAVAHVKSHIAQQQLQTLDVDPDDWIDFVEHGLNRQSLLEFLQRNSASSIVAVSNIPYSKTITERFIIDSLNSRECSTRNDSHWLLSTRQNAQSCPSLSAVDLLELAQRVGFRVEVSWARQHSQVGGMDAIFHHHLPANSGGRVMFQFPVDHQGRSHHSLANQPLRQQMKQRAEAQVYKALRTKLPSYMIPQRIIILDKMPLNRNGKIDRIALKKYLRDNATDRKPVQQPLSKSERHMQKIWGKLLGIEPATISLKDNFFSLGGNSIVAMRVVGEARAVGLNVMVTDIFSYPELRDVVRQAESFALH